MSSSILNSAGHSRAPWTLFGTSNCDAVCAHTSRAGVTTVPPDAIILSWDAAAFSRKCPDLKCDELLLKDQHPNAKGYGYAARTITMRLGAFTGAR